MFNKIKYAFTLIFLLSITSLTLQGSVVSFMKDGNAVKKQFFSNNIPTSEEEEDEHEVSKTAKELFFEISPYCDLSAVSHDIVWPGNTFLLCQNHLSIKTPPPEL